MSKPIKKRAAEAAEDTPMTTEEIVSETVEAPSAPVAFKEPVVETTPVLETPVLETQVEEEDKDATVRQEMKLVLRNAVKGACRPTLLQFEQRSGIPRNALIEISSEDVEKLWRIWRNTYGSVDQEGFVAVLLELMDQYPARIMRVAALYKLE